MSHIEFQFNKVIKKENIEILYTKRSVLYHRNNSVIIVTTVKAVSSRYVIIMQFLQCLSFYINNTFVMYRNIISILG